jgi:D-sedoheptulose 7-phosphate isomerase
VGNGARVFEHRELGHDVGASDFSIHSSEREKQGTSDLVAEVAASILMKVQDDSPSCARKSRARSRTDRQRLRSPFTSACAAAASSSSSAMAGLPPTPTISPSIACFRPAWYQSIPAVSLSLEPRTSPPSPTTLAPMHFPSPVDRASSSRRCSRGISTSGGSRNIIAALEEARKRNMLTVALLGYDGGEIKRKRLADFPVVVNCDYIPRIQEVQASIYHVIRESLEVLNRGQA